MKVSFWALKHFGHMYTNLLSILCPNRIYIVSDYICKSPQYHNQGDMYEKSLKYINMGFTGMFSVETVLKIIGFGVKVSVCDYEYSLMGKLATFLYY